MKSKFVPLATITKENQSRTNFYRNNYFQVIFINNIWRQYYKQSTYYILCMKTCPESENFELQVKNRLFFS